MREMFILINLLTLLIIAGCAKTPYHLQQRLQKMRGSLASLNPAISHESGRHRHALATTKKILALNSPRTLQDSLKKNKELLHRELSRPGNMKKDLAILRSEYSRVERFSNPDQASLKLIRGEAKRPRMLIPTAKRLFKDQVLWRLNRDPRRSWPPSPLNPESLLRPPLRPLDALFMSLPIW